MKKIVDVAIIGAGTAGMAAYRSVVAKQKTVALIEGSVYGTTCARVGCMPSKLLIAAAHAANSAKTGFSFGVYSNDIQINGVEVMQRVRQERDRFVGFVVDTVNHWPAEQRYLAQAHFIDAHTLELTTKDANDKLNKLLIQATSFVIATGSSPYIPAGWKEECGDRLVVNDDVFNWQTLPKSIAVVGTGVIGLELAQALHMLGVRVRLYGRNHKIGPLTNPDLAKLTTEIFSNKLDVATNAEQLNVSKTADGIVLTSTENNQIVQHQFEYILVTMGRTPNIASLNLSATGIDVNMQGLPISNPLTGQIGHSHIFMAGDVRNDRPLLHEAADEGSIAGANAASFPAVFEQHRRAPLAVVFSDPQIMTAGCSYATLVKNGIDFVTGTVSFSDQGRSRVMLVNEGALNIYADTQTHRLLGAEMIGPAAEHLGHLLSWSVQRGDTIEQMLDSPFYHPVIEEGLRTALRDVKSKLG